MIEEGVKIKVILWAANPYFCSFNVLKYILKVMLLPYPEGAFIRM